MDASSLLLYAIELIAAGCAATFLIADSLPLRAEEGSRPGSDPSASAGQVASRSICKHSTGQ